MSTNLTCLITVQYGFLYLIIYMIKAVAEIKKSFMSVLYIEMKYMNKSMYLTQKTIKYNS